MATAHIRALSSSRILCRRTTANLPASIVPSTRPFNRRTMASVASAPPHDGEKPFFFDEPTGPDMKTEIPGPKSKAAIERLHKVFDTRSLNMMGDYTKSIGN